MSAAETFDPICAHVLEVTMETGRINLPHGIGTLQRLWQFREHRRMVWAWRASLYRRCTRGAPRVRAGGVS